MLKQMGLAASLILMIVILCVGCGRTDTQKQPQEESVKKKPVIYLYPDKETEVHVQLELDGELICTYPKYDDGWDVIATPDGTLIDNETSREYSYLFWEGKSEQEWNVEQGFVVEGTQTADFLQEKLSYMGLEPREYNEFITFWLPHMEKNNYNLIYFAGSDYSDTAKLKISPEPDKVLRIFMVFKGIKEQIEIPEQKLEPFQRSGFTVIEWGGTEIVE